MMGDTSMSVKQSSGLTSVTVWQSSFVWTLENAAFCPKSCGESIESPPFSSGPRDELKWKLELMPRGSSSDSCEYVAVFLRLVSSTNGNIIARYEISFCSGGAKKRTLARTDLFRPSGVCGWNAFIKCSQFFTECENFPNNVAINCEINAAERVNWLSKDSKSVNFIAPHRPTSGPMLSLLNSGQFSDVTIIAGEGEEFKVHAAVLAAHSNKCSTIFQQWDCATTKTNLVLDLRKFDAFTIRNLLSFIYGGKLPNFIDVGSAERMLAVSHELGVESLKRVCEQVLETRISIANVSDFLLLSDLYEGKRLKRKCINFVLENVARVFDTVSWKSLACQRPNILKEIIDELTLVLSTSF